MGREKPVSDKLVYRDLRVERIPLLWFRGRLRNFELGNGTHIFDGLDDNLRIEHSHMSEPLPVDLVSTGTFTVGLVNLVRHAINTAP